MQNISKYKALFFSFFKLILRINRGSRDFNATAYFSIYFPGCLIRCNSQLHHKRPPFRIFDQKSELEQIEILNHNIPKRFILHKEMLIRILTW